MKRGYYTDGWSRLERVRVLGRATTLDGERGLQIVLPYRGTRMTYVAPRRFVARTRGGLRRRMARLKWAGGIAHWNYDPRFVPVWRKRIGAALLKVVAW